MTIQESNRLIAEFDGWKYVERGGIQCFVKDEYRKYYHDLEYHLSWSRLMPIVEKINKTYIPNNKYPAGVIIYSTTCHINDDTDIIIETTIPEGGHLIDCVYKAVIHFIQWYNQIENYGTNSTTRRNTPED